MIVVPMVMVYYSPVQLILFARHSQNVVNAVSTRCYCGLEPMLIVFMPRFLK